MKLLWARSNKIGSKFIRWCLDEPVSHFAIEFDNRIVFHSNFSGVYLRWANHFREENEVIFQLPFNWGLQEEEDLYQRVIQKWDGTPYDFKAYWYFAYRGLLYKFFGIELPKTNPFNKKGELICVELAGALGNGLVEKDFDLSIATPFRLFKHIQRVDKERSYGHLPAS